MTARVLPIRVRRVRLLTHPVRTRFPFRYGIASMTAMPHLFVVADVEIDGQPAVGETAENLPPKWFTKDPATTFEQDLPAMLEVIRNAVRLSVEAGRRDSVFELWKRLYPPQMDWAAERGHAPLLAGFGVSLIERAVLDALCRHLELPAHAVLRENALGIELGQIRPELAGFRLRDTLPARPLDTLAVRHTVGLGDPLDATDAAEPLADGLPFTLEENIRAYGLNWFKIKLSGEPAADGRRLARLAAIIPPHAPDWYRFTLDGNENYADIAAFRAAWEGFRADPAIAQFLDRGLAFVEQPLHRDRALADEVGEALRSWPEAPPMIIDEADGELASLPRALALGYRGASHKNCKGIVKGLANAALIAQRRRRQPAVDWQLSGEDLAILGPLGLPQDLAIMSALGISHVERNGHHYFRGLSQFPTPVQDQVLRDHPDLYERHPDGFARLRVREGRLELGTVNAAPFGFARPLNLTFADEVREGEGIRPG